MILKNLDYSSFSDYIKANDKRIIVFGAGVIGTVTLMGVFDKKVICEKIDFYVDNEQAKQGTFEPVSGKRILSVDALKSIDPRKQIILITISRYYEVIEQLKKYENLNNAECYILPMMCITSFIPSEKDDTRKDSAKPIIPRTIHYMWLGGKTLPQPLQKCVDSWKRVCPEYSIVEWNEHNYDIGKHLYMKQAYENKCYGFVPDYARLDILYEHGGIYLDTDVELIRSLDDMLYQEAFCCVEKWQTINFGGGSGAVKGQEAIKELLDSRKKESFINSDGSLNKTTCGYTDTLTAIKHGYKLNNTVQNILGMNVYTYEYFHPYDYMSGRTVFTDHTFAIHHYDGGWMDDKMKEANRLTAERFEAFLSMAEKETYI